MDIGTDLKGAVAVTLGELRKLVDACGLRYAVLPDEKGLVLQPSEASSRPAFLIVLTLDGRMVQFRTIGYLYCPPGHPHLEQVVTLLAEFNRRSAMVRYNWERAEGKGQGQGEGEIIVGVEIWIGDGELTVEQFRNTLRRFLQAIEEPRYRRIHQTLETGRDPGVRVPMEGRSLARDDMRAQLAALGRARGLVKQYVATPYTPDLVDCAVFSQREVRPGDSVLVQVFAYLPGYAQEAQGLAQEYDEEAKRLGSVSLATEIMRGSVLTFELVVGDLPIPDPVQNLAWRGKTQSVQFEVPIPRQCGSGNLIGKVLISQNTIPIGQIRIKVKVVSRDAAADARQHPTGDPCRYQMAFISYASSDRPEVLRRVQMLPAVGIRFFQDVIDLDPGERWAQELYRHIDESDVLFLFWSTAARDSEWVRREWQYGLEKKGKDFIHPIIIEGPPPPAPPPELADLHFADPMIYFISAR